MTHRQQTTSKLSQKGKEEKKMKKEEKEKEEEQHFEFLGPYFGPYAMVAGLPFVCYLLAFSCNKHGCVSLSDPFHTMPTWDLSSVFTFEAVGVYLGWMIFQVAMHLLLPGKTHQGVELNGYRARIPEPEAGGKYPNRLTYKTTALQNFVITMAVLIVFGFIFPILNLSWAYDHFIPLLTASILGSCIGSIYLYVSSFVPGKLLAKGGHTGVKIYDFFIGRELNPRIYFHKWTLDLKEWCELYPGLIGWVALDLCMLRKYYEVHHTFSPALLLVTLFQGIYVLDALWNEPAILTTMDITTDGFGFMLCFGDLVWVPFTYTLQARLLVDYSNNVHLSVPAMVGLFVLNMIGYSIFRGANSQKDEFRQNPNSIKSKKMKSLQTQRGTKLIISGWWGMSRHINYFGDWVMAWAWCLPLGSSCGVIPYFYVIYFAVLLVHRARRDDAACRLKYGADWDKYCALVPSRIIPYIY